VAKPGEEEIDHPWITVGKRHLSIALRTLARVEGGAGHEELTLGEPTDPLASLLEEGVDLGLLAAMMRAGCDRKGSRYSPSR
jgi:hypothetical protein